MCGLKEVKLLPLWGFMLVVIIALAGYASFLTQNPTTYNSNHTLKLNVPEGGHGSGTHIGGGYIITAGHVAEDNEYLLAKTSSGDIMQAERLWTNMDYDISLLRIEDYEDIAVSDLECRPLVVGEAITLEGNPLAMEFITTNGIVAGEPTSSYSQAWQTVVPVDGAMAGGMSGGGAFDEDGDLVGVNVGIPVQSLGFADGTATGISFIVPSTAVCNLLAR